MLNVLIGIGYMTYDFSGDFPNAEPFIFKVFGLISFLNAYLVYLLFKWKKVGFYVFTGIALFAFAINFSITNSLVDAAYGLLAPLILYLFMRPQWDLFE